LSKVKIVQIATAGTSEDIWVEYLDDKGRIWTQTGKWVYPQGVGARNKDGSIIRNWVNEWNQTELPEEPQS
jgi:hypothetical protein